MIRPNALLSQLFKWFARLGQRSWRMLRYYYWRLVRLQDPPEYLARGVAAGVFAGCFPLFGVQTLVGVLLAVLVRGHKLCAAAGTWISNPLTYLPIYWINFQIGRFLLGSSRDATLTQWDSLDGLLSETGEVVADLFVGSIVVGAVASVASYTLTLRVVRLWRKRRRERQLRKAAAYDLSNGSKIVQYNRERNGGLESRSTS
ncbi:DUF2062 domain-containing protein [Baaleninema simplex]|uniref:DUF2062 domain-containing protein n=1 Tax=Baaleninema simplex TaxID=2862350 RepID=UPI00034CC842|nr:DUF2062 domain-containing protein [Baaleninema simplex]